MDIKEEYQSLLAQITKHDDLYYNQDRPVISDDEYDSLYIRLVKLVEAHPNDLELPARKVGGKVSSLLNKITHDYPMLSLANSFFKDELKRFINKVGDVSFCSEPKIDGLSFSATYHNHKLVRGATRGDGMIGEDITDNLKYVIGLPQIIPIADDIEVRGEVYMSKENFVSLNQHQQSLGKDPFATPRNAAAGSLRQLDPLITKERKLNYFVWGGNTKDLGSQYDMLKYYESLGFVINHGIKRCSGLDELWDYYLDYQRNRDSLPYDIDGVVYKVDEFSLQESLGNTAHSPRWAIAQKFPAESSTTVVDAITIQVGRTGSLTPVAELRPVHIGGVVIARASLHNQAEIERLDIRIGDTVIIKRAGDVIPKIVEVVVDKRTLDSQKFQFPTTCPSCNNELQGRCVAGYKCESQAIERLAHFVSRSAFNIIGLGKQQLKDLYADGLITTPADIFTLEERNALKTNTTKLYKSIQRSKEISLDKFIYSLGIPSIGASASKALVDKYQTLSNLRNSPELATFLSDQSNKDIFESLAAIIVSDNKQ